MLKQILIALDQLLNTLIWLSCDGMGRADETMSARAWRLRKYSSAYVWIDRLFFWDKNHCEDSYAAELERRQLPSAYKVGAANAT